MLGTTQLFCIASVSTYCSHMLFEMKKNVHMLFRGTNVSRHKGSPIKGPHLNPSIQYWCDGPNGFRCALNWAPVMPRDASLSDSYTSDRCCFSRLVLIFFRIMLWKILGTFPAFKILYEKVSLFMKVTCIKLLRVFFYLKKYWIFSLNSQNIT